MILDWEGNRALVKADKEDKRVFIAVKGPTSRGRRELLSITRHDFEHIHRSFKFAPEEMIPVCAAAELLVPYKKLLVMERANIKQFTEVAGEEILELGVQELLNGVDLEGTRRPPREEPV